jgi:hypothetical protein
LKTHGDAADHAQGEGQGKNLDPELVGIHPVLLPSRYKAGFEKQQKPAHSDADGGEQNMKVTFAANCKRASTTGSRVSMVYLIQ